MTKAPKAPKADSPRAVADGAVVVRCVKCSCIRLKSCENGACAKHCRRGACKAHTELAMQVAEAARVGTLVSLGAEAAHHASHAHRGKCPSEGCNKVPMNCCIFKMCTRCCKSQCEYEDRTCEPHLTRMQDAQRTKDNKARYLEVAVQAVNKARTKRTFRFDHPEKGFTEYGQTVVIWCLSDFMRNQNLSQGTFDACTKKKRLEEKAVSRALQRGEVSEGGGDGGEGRGCKTARYYERRWLAIKRKWGV